MIKEKIIKDLRLSLANIKAPEIEIDLEHPSNFTFGDFTTTIALKLAKLMKEQPISVAQKIVKNLDKNNLILKTEIAGPGFINFWVKDEYFLKGTRDSYSGNFVYEPFHFGKNKKIMVEFAHPNTHKLFHIGHLRNISTGESVVRILEAVGNKVIRANYQGDVGLHIAKCLWFIKQPENKKALDKAREATISEKISFLGKAYSKGQIAYTDDEKAKKEIIHINKMIYEKSPEILPLWQETRQWSLDYFQDVYKRVGSYFDRLYFESEFYERGVELCQLAFKKGILEKSQGAIVFNGKKYGLDTRVFINSLGFPTYEGKELGLAEKESSEFGDLDKIIHCVTPEQKSFFKVTFKVEELINEKLKNKQYHLAYNWVNLKEGKMSSRTGNVIEASWLIDKTKEKILEKFKCGTKVAEVLAIAATKYSFLKNSTENEIAFDLDESISVEGNSAPYLIYTYVRCQSILKKEEQIDQRVESYTPNKEESELLRIIERFPETVNKSAKTLSPNIIANYLYEVATLFNIFYQKNPVLKSSGDTKQVRLVLTKAVSNIISKGLYLLGINTVEKM